MTFPPFHARYAWLSAAALITAGPVAALAAPLTFNTALPVAKGEFVTRVQYVREQSGYDPSGQDRDRMAQSLVGVLGYGATGKLALFGVLPYADKDLELSIGDQPIGRSASGLGDLSLFGRYTLYQNDRPGRTFRLAPFLGVKVPTGSDDRKDGLGRLPPPVQSGSGSWDGFGGLVATYQTLEFQLDGQLGFRVNGEANGLQAGNELRADASVQYRLWPRSLGAGVPGFLYGVLEANLIHRQKDETGGRGDPDSGGTTLFLSPGLQYVTKRWILEGGVQLPVAQNLNGDALEADYVARFGFRVNF